VAFDPILAEIRFGNGLSPTVARPQSVNAMLDRLAGPDHAAAAFPIPTFATAYPSPLDLRTAFRAVNQASGEDEKEAAEQARADMREAARELSATGIRHQLARDVATNDSFRERLVRFWADHFTVRVVSGGIRHMVSPHIEEFIRPHVTGRFEDLLIAAITSPLMIYYLDQHESMGPNSELAQRRNRGMNENLARELLELHTLGVGGAYSQTDVLELAELLTGLTASTNNGMEFKPRQAEPGPETVLGVTYGGNEESLDHIHAALRNLAVHPDTARHLAHKLVVHFVGPEPEQATVEQMAAAYLAADGDLMALYEGLLTADSSWAKGHQKVKPPYDFVASSLRALAVPIEDITGARSGDVIRYVYRPLSVMGQTWQEPVGPDGWPEAAEDWIIPQAMAGRITWAMQVPKQILHRLPDPREFVSHALGDRAPDAVVFAAGAAETISDGIGIVLASAAFQRR